MKIEYEILPELFLRAPYYSYLDYDPERLPEILEDPVFRNALWLASRAFYQQLNRKEFRYDCLSEKEQFSLLKYYNRMCFRPTPFGSFASFSIGAWSDNEPARLSPDNLAMIHLLPDLQWLDRAAGLLNSGDAAALLQLNPTLYLLGSEYRFIRSAPDKKGKLSFALDALPAEPLNAELVSLSRKGPITAAELADWIRLHSGCSVPEATEYVGFLISSQVLICNNQIPLAGGEKLRLRQLPASLRNLLKASRQYPNTTPVQIADRCAEIEKFFPLNVALDDTPLFYAALERKWDAGGPPAQDGSALLEAVKVLHGFSTPGAPPELARFTAAFLARFDQRKVAILEALDPDSGIVYGRRAHAAYAPGHLNDIRFPDAPVNAAPLDWTDQHRRLFSRWMAAKQQGPYSTVTLLAEDIDDAPGPLPPTLAVMFRKTGDHLLIEYAGGVSATSLVGRFSAFSEETHALCRKLAALESAANPGVIFADIDLRSDLHSDNINRREMIYDYCIPINTFASGPGVLELTDLLLSVRGGELLLESRSSGKRIIPRLATAYNYQLSGLGIFSLLCDLQYQGSGAIRPFNMEHFFPGERFYPRVVSGQTILCAAKWKFEAKEIGALLDPAGGGARERIRQFRMDNGLPFQISLGAFDQQLIFDLEDEQQINFFFTCLKGRESVTLHEQLHSAKCVKSMAKPLAGQFIAFLFHANTIYPGMPTTAPFDDTIETRNFLLGDEWLYLKIYCTPQVADQILGGVLPLFVSQQEQELYCWFFIRYNEGGDHLRIRFKTHPSMIGRLLVNFLAILRLTGTDQLIRSYQGDTYQRELERYRPEFIGLVENVFREGSGLVCSRLANASTESGSTGEFLFALATADRLLHTFLKPWEITGFCALVLENFHIEFGGGKQLKSGMDTAYRKLKHEIEITLMKHHAVADRLPSAKLLAEAAGKLPGMERNRLLADIIHMQMNRSFQTRQRHQEYFVYHCLLKYRSSAAAKANHSA